eukprot:c24184_g1_i1 orf=488-5599(-)
MATGDRRLVPSARRGMTVLGKIPSVPKPINLPSQRLENRGLDPSVEIVPRGTFSWGTGRSPPASSSSWGNVGLSSSPPVSTGAWNSTSTSVQPVSSSNNITGGLAQNPPRPLSAGSTRPLSAGTTRPLSGGSAWGGAVKLEEQLQPSRFNLTTVDFPTLGSEKNPNLRPQQNTAASNRPTSADATKQRHLAYTGTSFSRPTSADGSKERKPGYPGIASADRPTSADGGRHQPDTRLATFPPFADKNLMDQRHPVYTGVVGHGTAGPGPGTHGHSLYPPLVQQGIPSPGSHMMPIGEIMYPNVSQHDQYSNRPQAPHSNMEERDVLELPMDSRPGVYRSYPSDSGPNHLDRSRVYQSHHSQSRWEPNDLDRSGVYQSHHLQSGSSEHLRHGMVQIEPRPSGTETSMQRGQPVVDNRRDGYNITNKYFAEQRGGWAGRNAVYIGSPIDARDPLISNSGTGRELQKPDTFITSWEHQPKHSGWGDGNSGDTSVGMYRGGASSAIYKQATLLEKMPQGSVLEGGSEIRHMEESRGKGAGHAGETLHLMPSEGSGHGNQGDVQPDSLVFPSGASVTGKASKLPGTGVTEISNSVRQDVQYHKQEETARNLASKTMIGGPEVSELGNNTLDNAGPGDGSAPGSGASVGTQPSKLKQEDEGSRAEQSREPQRTELVSNVAVQRQQDNRHDNIQSKDNFHIVDTDSTNGFTGAAKNITAKKKFPISQRFTKVNRKKDLSPSLSHESEETTCASKNPLSKASDENRINGGTSSSSAVFSTPSGKESNSDVSSGVQGTSDAMCIDACSKGAHGAVQTKSSTHTEVEGHSAGDHKVVSTPKPNFSVAPIGEAVAIPSSEEEGQAPDDNGSSMKTRQNSHPSRRPHHSRSMHDTHSADKQHVNHGMVWAPVKNSTTVGATKEENLLHIGKAGKMQESLQQIPTLANQEKPMQPSQEHQPTESQGQRHAQQVQKMQSAASSQQGQGHQTQEHSVVSNRKHGQQTQHQKVEFNQQGQGHQMEEHFVASSKKHGQQMQHQRVEFNFKKQGQRTQQQWSRSSDHTEREQCLQQEPSTAENQNLGTKQHQSVASSHVEQGQPQSQFMASRQREVHLKEILPAKEQQEKAGESGPIPVADRFEGKKNKDESTIYTLKPARSQQHQRREQEYEQKSVASSHHGQSFLNKGDGIVVEDQENQPSETLTLPVAELTKNKSYSSRTSKQQKRHQHESSASLNGGPEPSLVAEPEAIKDKEESRTYHQKLVRQQEMQNKQSAAVTHQGHNQIGEEYKKPFSQTPENGSSTIKNERKFYVPKQARKQYMHQQEFVASGYQGQRSQEQANQESRLSNEKAQQYAQTSQLSGVESNAKKGDIELYTPKPSRQQHMQGHQSAARGQRRQTIVDLVEEQSGQDVMSSSGTESPLHKDNEITRRDSVSNSMRNKDVVQSCVTGNRDESKSPVSSEFSQGKKEIKYYASKPGRQQQESVLNVDQGHVEAPMREGPSPQEKLERSHQMPKTEPIKKKDEIRRYTPKPARQREPTESSAVLEGTVVKETGELSLPEQREQQRSGNDERARELEHGYKNRNYSTKPHKSAAVPRLQTNTQPAVEDGTVDGHVSRDDKAVGFHQKTGPRQRHYDAVTLEDAEVYKGKQYQKRQYHYQRVVQQSQTVKPQEEVFNVDYEHKLGTRQLDQGQNRYERREGPSRRGRSHGYGYRAADQAG